MELLLLQNSILTLLSTEWVCDCVAPTTLENPEKVILPSRILKIKETK